MQQYLEYNIIQKEIVDFLSDADILQCLLTCSKMKHIEYCMPIRKQNKVDTIFYYFTNYAGNLSTCMCAEYDSNYKNYVTSFFYLLPELFAKMEKNTSIKWFIMSWIKSLDKFENSQKFTEQFDMHSILEQLLTLINNNRTLYGCGLGLFNHIISVPRLKNLLQNHPTLEYISLNRIDKNIKEDKIDLYKFNGSVVQVCHEYGYNC